MEKKRFFIGVSVVLIVVSGFVVYFNSLNNGFIWDDYDLVRDNVYVKRWSSLPLVFSTDVAAGGGRQYNFYRPLQMLTYFSDYSLWKLNSVGYHLTNVVLHVLAALTLFWLVVLLFGNPFLSLVTALLFVVHPVHTEAVAYVSGRADSLAAIFLLLSLVFYHHNFRSDKPIFFVAACLSYVLALLSRENVLILPALLLLYHYFIREKPKAGRFLLFLFLALLYAALRSTILRALLPQQAMSPGTWWQRLPGFFVAFGEYVRILPAPVNLHPEYGRELFAFADPRALAGAVLLAVVLVLLFLTRNRIRLAFFALGWFILNLLPVANFYPINAYLAEHWLYLPSMGFFLLAAWGIDGIYRRRRAPALILTVVLAVSYAFLAMKQADLWKDGAAFYERALRYAPKSVRTMTDLGIARLKQGQTGAAVEVLEQATRLDPGYADAFNSLGNAYKIAGRYPEAEEAYKRAFTIKPDYAGAYNNLGMLYDKLIKKEEAIACYLKAIEANPGFVPACNNLGVTLDALGREEEAENWYRKALLLNPDFADAYNNLAVILSHSGRKTEAIGALEKALRINPRLAAAHTNLAMIYYDLNDYRQAIGHCDQAIALGYQVNPRFLKALDQHRQNLQK